jgi:isopentenyldiphosphate isomerase
MSFLDRIRESQPPDFSAYLSFIVEGAVVGYVKPDFAAALKDFPDTFVVGDKTLRLNESLLGVDERTAAVGETLERLMQRGDLPGWRGEKYKVATSFAGPALFDMERAAMAHLGTIGYGVHLNGIVEAEDGRSMWIARRSLSKQTGPGKLDQIVAGGHPIGISLKSNLIKECAEEAAIPAHLANASLPVGTVSYATERPEGLFREVLFLYDLVLPADFTPINNDGEVEDFQLMAMADVARRVRDSDDFEFNCALVVIDFLIRHGYIEVDHPDYIDLISGLHGL